MLQVEEGSEVGWLLYSTREMDAGALSDVLEEWEANPFSTAVFIVIM